MPPSPVPPPASAGRQASSGPVTPAAVPITAGSPVRRQRRWSVVALCVVLAAVGALGATAAVTSAGHRVNVLAVAKDVPAGQQLTDDDLTVAAVAADPALTPVAASEERQVVGRRAAVDLRRGQMLTRSDLTVGGGLADGQETVGVAVKRGFAPDGLAPGVEVLAVVTPADGQKLSGVPVSIPATVVTVGQPDATGVFVITLAVLAGGPTLAARAAAGQIAIVRQPLAGS